jgi:hypothetical protein
MGYAQLSGDEWVKIIDKLPGDAVIFSGGEPCLHPDIASIINRISKKHIYLYTNITFKIDKILNRLNRKINFFTSYHPSNKAAKEELILENLEQIRDSGKANKLTVHAIAQEFSQPIEPIIKRFADHGFELPIDRNQYEDNIIGIDACNFKQTQTVRCRYNRLYIGPNGKRYICVSKMIRNQQDGIIPVSETDPEMICHEFGLCSPCDEVAIIEKI